MRSKNNPSKNITCFNSNSKEKSSSDLKECEYGNWTHFELREGKYTKGTVKRNDKGSIVVNYTFHGHKKEFEIRMDSTSYCVGFVMILKCYIRCLDVCKINFLKFQHQSFVRSASRTVEKEMGKLQFLF